MGEGVPVGPPAETRSRNSLNQLITRLVWFCMLPLIALAVVMAIYEVTEISREQAAETS